VYSEGLNLVTQVFTHNISMQKITT